MGGLKLGGVLEEGVPNREGSCCFGNGDGSGDDAGIVTTVDRELGVFHGVHVYGLLLAANGGRRLYGHTPHDGRAGGDAAQVHHGFSAGSYRDLTRVAHLNPQMWSELMIDDADALAFEIDHLIDSLGAYSRALKDRDQRYLENLLAEGDRIKRALDDEASH